jgi:hypothetical protein
MYKRPHEAIVTNVPSGLRGNFLQVQAEKEKHVPPAKRVHMSDRNNENELPAVTSPHGTRAVRENDKILRSPEFIIKLNHKEIPFYDESVPSNPSPCWMLPDKPTFQPNEEKAIAASKGFGTTSVQTFYQEVTLDIVKKCRGNRPKNPTQAGLMEQGANEFMQQRFPYEYNTIVQITGHKQPFSWLHEIGCCINLNPQKSNNLTIGTQTTNDVMTAQETAIIRFFLNRVKDLNYRLIVSGQISREYVCTIGGTNYYSKGLVIYNIIRPDGNTLTSEIPAFLFKKTTIANKILKDLTEAFLQSPAECLTEAFKQIVAPPPPPPPPTPPPSPYKYKHTPTKFDEVD